MKEYKKMKELAESDVTFRNLMAVAASQVQSS